MRETTALGAAIAAGFAVGIWPNKFDDLKGINRENRTTFTPETDKETRRKLFELWERAVKKAQGWVDVEDGKEGPDL